MNTKNNGHITKYDLKVSTDGENWTLVNSGPLENNSDLKEIKFNSIKARYIRFIAKEGIGGFAWAAELNVYKIKAELPQPPLEAKKSEKVTTFTVVDNLNEKSRPIAINGWTSKN